LRTDGILGNFKVFGTIYLITKESYVHNLHYEIGEKIRISEGGKISCGLSILPGRQGITIRALGNSTEDLKDMIFEVIDIARKRITSASFSGLRKS